MEKIGLFPIKNVLFPGSVLPLHVFEGRYIKLINYSYIENKTFGINLKDAGKIHEFGCLAKVSDVVKHFDDGRMDVLLEGLKRFRIVNKALGEFGYEIAEIEMINDYYEKYNTGLFERCIEIYNIVVDHVNTVDIKKIEKDKLKTDFPSYFIAQKSGLNLKQKYQMLLFDHENDRLDFILTHLESILPMIKEAEFVTKIIKNDGYYKPSFLQSE